MTVAVVPLVTGVDDAVWRTRIKASEFKERIDSDEFVVVAMIGVRRDGSAIVMSDGRGDRLRLLGAITDLQYMIAKDGDG